MKIAIAHSNIVSRDAIGHDILGMHHVLTQSGFDVELVGDHFDAEIHARVPTCPVEAAIGRQDFSLLIYHHSILWRHGETLFKESSAARVMKYHNVTPPEFFVGYSKHDETHCRAGREQTARLIQMLGPGDIVTADSAYNAAELRAAGAGDVVVVPPFNVIAPHKQAEELPRPRAPLSLLFVGRAAPNKGHFDLLNTVAAYVAKIGPDVRLILVGGFDQASAAYRAEIDARIETLGLTDKIEIRTNVDGAALKALFQEADAYLCLSEHEGFCVPLVEAQASGLPVITSSATALGETAGVGQLVVDPPRSVEDYVYIARLVHAACTDMDLRRQVIANGYRNVLTRFGHATIADQFMGSLAPILKRLS